MEVSTINGFLGSDRTSKYASPNTFTFLSPGLKAVGKNRRVDAFNHTLEPSGNAIWYCPPLGVSAYLFHWHRWVFFHRPLPIVHAFFSKPVAWSFIVITPSATSSSRIELPPLSFNTAWFLPGTMVAVAGTDPLSLFLTNGFDKGRKTPTIAPPRKWLPL